jgi:heat shock protein HslJ
MAITAMACLSPEGVMDQEQVCVRALGSAAT